jgi:N6-adenosine-specific RNA methylase IME4
LNERSARPAIIKSLAELFRKADNVKRRIKRYQIIYADPPWAYKDRTCQGSAEQHYSTMGIENIKGLSVENIAAENCVLFLWSTYPFLPEALEVIEAWGFKYKTIAFQWVKTNRSGKGFFFGIGHWTRSNTECCLLATRGKPKPISKSISQLIIEPLTHHSAKPPIVREKIVQLMGDLPRIELFARDSSPGWDSWGNECSRDVVLER